MADMQRMLQSSNNLLKSLQGQVMALEEEKTKMASQVASLRHEVDETKCEEYT